MYSTVVWPKRPKTEKSLSNTKSFTPTPWDSRDTAKILQKLQGCGVQTSTSVILERQKIILSTISLNVLNFDEEKNV